MLRRPVGVEAVEDEVGALAIVLALLRQVRDRYDDVKAARTALGASDRREVTLWRRGLVEELQQQPSRAALLTGRDLLDLLTAHPGPAGLDPLLAARQVAMALDVAFAERFYSLIESWYWERRSVAAGYEDLHWAVVRPDDPIPLSLNHRDAVRVSPRSSKGATAVEQRVDRVNHLSLAPRSPGDVTIDFRLSDALEGWPTLSIALGVPTADRRDFQMGEFPFGPRDPAAVATRIERQLDQAAELQCQLAVFPELTITPETRHRVCQTWSGQPPARSLLALAPGTEHLVEDDGTRSNAASVFGRADATRSGNALPPFAHRKFEPLMHVQEAEAWAKEPIDPQGVHIRLHVSRGLKVALLICRDFLADGVAEKLIDLEPDIVLVPAWTPEFDLFEGRAGYVAREALCEVYIVNGWIRPKGRRRQAGLVAHPKMKAAMRPVHASSDGPGIAVIAGHGRQVRLNWFATSE